MTPLNKKFVLVDDDEDDARLFCEALYKKAPGTVCHTVENGSELLDYLSGRTDKPDMIFLDINMPIMNGWDCLKNLKLNPDYKSIPVIMYSTSSAKRDIDMAYSLGALLFVTKPEDFIELSEILKVVAFHSEELLSEQLKGFASVK